MASKVSSSSIGTYKLHSGWTSSAAAEEIKNGINNKHYGSHSNIYTTLQATGYDDYDFPPDAMVNRPTIYIDTEEQESDNSFDSDDDYANPESESSKPTKRSSVKRSSSFGKTALHSLKRTFITKGKIPDDSNSLHTPLINHHSRTKSLGSINQTRLSKPDHVKVKHSDLSKGTLTKSVKPKSRSNPSFK